MSALRDIAPAALGPPTVHERGFFVAVPALRSGGEPDAGAPRRAERRTTQRRLSDQALQACLGAVPVVASCLIAALACAVLVVEASAWSIGWAGATSMAATAWMSMPRWARKRRPAGADTRRQRHQFAELGLATLVLLALAPWLPGSALALNEQLVLLAVLGAVAMICAATLVALPEFAVIAVMLPLSSGLAMWSTALTMDSSDRDAMLACLLLAAAAAAVAWTSRRHWLREERRRVGDEDRIRDLERERDDALRADQEKSRFLAIASHDLRQPVHALGLFAATLEKRLHGTREEPLVRNLVRSIDGLDRSFYAMLDISRLDAGTVEPNFQHFPLRDLFRRLHMHYAGQAEQAGLNLRFSPGGKSVTSDPQLLERILGNLIQNAIKYTQHGGIVVVARSTQTHFNVEVWDTGVGIRPNELPRVFDEFYQVGRDERRRVQGLGMGLAIVKRLVRLLGHSLTVSSQPRRGTMFRVGISKGALPDIQDATAAADTLPMPALQPRMVLIIDDEEAIRDGLGLLLEEWGYQALAAGSVEQALHTVRELDLPPDLILSDLHLGDGPDGLAAVEAVRRECGCDVPAIIITGDTSNEEMRRATDSGHPVLYKPVQPRKLLNALRGLVS